MISRVTTPHVCVRYAASFVLSASLGAACSGAEGELADRETSSNPFPDPVSESNTFSMGPRTNAPVPPEPTSDPLEPKGFVGTTEQSSAEIFRWSANEADVLMRPVSTHACFMSRVSGNLGGRSAVMVHHNQGNVSDRCAAGWNDLLFRDDDIGPTWKLSGCQNELNSLTVEAICVPGTNFILDPGGLARVSPPNVAAYTGTACSGQGWADLWPGAAVSYLTAVTGRFDGGGEVAETIYAAAPNGSTSPARLHVEQHSCYAIQAWGYSMYAGLPPQATLRKSYTISATRNESKSKPMLKTREGVCYLTRLSGDFNGSPERIRIHPKKDAAGVEYWSLDAHADRGNAYATAECVYYDQRVSGGPIF